ncbi:MAG: hypothetical protein ACK4I8_07905 [Armatimonadota bacterium]
MSHHRQMTERNCAEQIQRVQREAIEKFKALLKERVGGQDYQLFEPDEETMANGLYPTDLIVVLPKLPSSLEENLNLRKPIDDAYWQVWEEYQPKLGELFFHVMVFYPDEVGQVGDAWRKIPL